MTARRTAPNLPPRSSSSTEPTARVGERIKLDLERHARTGVPEVILAEGKTPQDVRAAALAMVARAGRAIVTRVEPDFDWGPLSDLEREDHLEARIVVLRRRGQARLRTGGRIAVLTAGASDRRVAAEAEVICGELGCEVESENDVGVAGLHRLLAALERFRGWDPHVYIVCAGREGALAPITAGLVGAPVIGVPVSTGYGHAGRGEAALSTMLQSCAPLVTVNIDAGFVAGAVAAQFANRATRHARKTILAPNP